MSNTIAGRPEPEELRPFPLPERKKDSHKGSYGTLLQICGSYGMCGAGILSAKGAYRSGVGMVRAAIPRRNYAAFCTAVPDAVTLPCPTSFRGQAVFGRKKLKKMMGSATAVLIGCGLGNTRATLRLVKDVLAFSRVPVVLDADALNALSRKPDLLLSAKAPVILTPHPVEMGRLASVSTGEIQKDRIGHAEAFAKKYNCISVLKGNRTVIALPDGKTYENPTGNPGMAVAGMGDVLAGMIGGLLARGLTPEAAACNGVYYHGLAGDRCAEKLGEEGLRAVDLPDLIAFS